MSLVCASSRFVDPSYLGGLRLVAIVLGLARYRYLLPLLRAHAACA